MCIRDRCCAYHRWYSTDDNNYRATGWSTWWWFFRCDRNVKRYKRLQRDHWSIFVFRRWYRLYGRIYIFRNRCKRRRTRRITWSFTLHRWCSKFWNSDHWTIHHKSNQWKIRRHVRSKGFNSKISQSIISKINIIRKQLRLRLVASGILIKASLKWTSFKSCLTQLVSS